MDTLLLDRTAWDFVTDVNGNVAVASNPYSQAQDAASEIRLFQGEAWYDTTRGLPYWQSILGRLPPLALIKAKLNSAALLVPGIVAVQCFISSFRNRRLTGQVQIFDSAGKIVAASNF